MPKEQAIQYIKDAIKNIWPQRREVIQKNFKAVDQTLENLFHIDYSSYAVGRTAIEAPVSENAPDFVQHVLGRIIAGEGDELPVSAFPIDGTYPSGTTRWEKEILPSRFLYGILNCVLSAASVISFVRMPRSALKSTIAKNWKRHLLSSNSPTLSVKEFFKDKEAYTLQVAVEDCTGCKLCTEVCRSKAKHNRAIKQSIWLTCCR